MSASYYSPRRAPLTNSRMGRETLVIALLNNMPDAALQSTELQFSELLARAGAAYDVRLRLFSFPELIRGEAGRRYVAEHYEPIEALWSGNFDGLIVTGAEPRTASLAEEVYWPSLTRLVDWALDSATPTVWSCLAAHAAVLHLDGVQRQRLGQKISGLFRCEKTSDDALVAGLPSSWRIPHSRLNTLDPEQLAAAGYEIMSCSDEAGVDTFLLRRSAAFVFYQGHPEYDAGALFREYRRDVGRYLAGTMEHYPEMPRGYFDDQTARAFAAFRDLAERERTRQLLEAFPGRDAGAIPPHLWLDAAIRLYSNWLSAYVADGRAAAATVAAAPPVRVN
jgi:homoserine O-succinyltransferase/O-acetyltransferase